MALNWSMSQVCAIWGMARLSANWIVVVWVQILYG